MENGTRIIVIGLLKEEMMFIPTSPDDRGTGLSCLSTQSEFLIYEGYATLDLGRNTSIALSKNNNNKNKTNYSQWSGHNS